MNRNNKIISIAILALSLGVMPQAQGMGYFKAAYNSAFSWGKKAVNSALTVKSQAMARIAMIVNHILPKKQITANNDKDCHSTESLDRAYRIMEHVNPTQNSVDNPALQRAAILVSHIVPTQTVGVEKPVMPAKPEEKLSTEHYFKDYLFKNYQHSITQRLEPILKVLLSHEVGQEDVFNTQDVVIGKLYFHKLDLEDAKTLNVIRLHNKQDEFIGFCVAEADLLNQEGFIAYLLITQNERQNGYGGVLLAHITKMLYQDNCTKIKGEASSFNLRQGERKETMQPKLEGFYGQFGAESLDGSKSRLGLSLL